MLALLVVFGFMVAVLSGLGLGFYILAFFLNQIDKNGW